ncbi:hypothetical protein HU200_038583 [Digitaria exilis]|uniref:DUF8040 domain-containing protein n=1 Tax=Digitaria exilis TaxID=1010633 RepID=A0A835BCK5_9POAL|nr:hypothetical protein HU200_038583 [Digitaria exilis]
MARLPLSARTRRRNMALRSMLTSIITMYYFMWLLLAMAYKMRCLKIEQMIRNGEQRSLRLSQLIHDSDATCISQIHMDRRTFHVLCEMLSDVGGLKATRNMSLEEIVAQFLYILAHHLKNRTIKDFFFRSELFGSFRWNSYKGNHSN